MDMTRGKVNGCKLIKPNGDQPMLTVGTKVRIRPDLDYLEHAGKETKIIAIEDISYETTLRDEVHGAHYLELELEEITP